ncbi:MAG TPA: nitroreductase family protein [Ramlibacter sp.]|nr:nitroreductase family protein [Ramlibacter sp.]
MHESYLDTPFRKPAPADYPIHEALRQRWSPRAFSRDDVAVTELHQLFEALRWSPSAFNEQPWSFLVGLRQQPEEFGRLLGCLTPGNQAWAKDAAGLFVTVARRDWVAKPQPNRTAQYDLGQAVANFTFQATTLGLIVHQMAGIDLERVRVIGAIPEGYNPVTAVAFGRPGDPAQLPEDVRKKDATPRLRKRLPDFVFGATWGRTASWLEQRDPSDA